MATRTSFWHKVFASPRSAFLALALAAFIITLDQASKYWVLYIANLPFHAPVEVTSFFNLVMVWNRGVSFGMFADHGNWIPYILITIAMIIVLVLLWWLKIVQDRFVALAIGLVIGGAIGNVVDRILFGAVVDFLDFHVAGYHWPAFNVADASIFIGVMLLCYDSLFRQQPSA